MSENHDGGQGFGCSLACLAVTVIGGIILMLTPQTQYRWLTLRIVLPIWGVAALIVAVVFTQGKGIGADSYSRGAAAGAGIVLLCLLASVILFLLLCTGLVSGPMKFR